MSEKHEIEEEDEGNVTSPEKAEDEEVRNFKEEPGDDDGENRHPKVRNSMLYTSLLVVKGMIGAGILNLPLIFKTFGILGGIILTVFINFVSVFVAYFLGRSKELSQRYSYAVYSKIVLGNTGTIIMKICLFIMFSTLSIVQLIVFGDVLKGLSLLFCNINVKILIAAIAIILMPFMFQKDISGITNFAYLGIVGLAIFYITTVILFLYKYSMNQIIYDKSMLYPNGTFKELFQCVGGYYNAYSFHGAYFSYYLPLKPRNTKTMMKSVIIGSIAGSFIYSSYGILFFLIYGNKITDSALKYLQNELEQANKNNEKKIVLVLVICFLCFIINACISTMIHFYLGKSNLIGIIKYFLKYLQDKNKEKNDIPLVDITDIKQDNGEEKTTLKDEKELLSERKQFYITFLCYIYVLIMALTFDKIIILDSFNGSTMACYINLMAPSIFYFYFAKGKKYYGEKFIALFNLLFGVGLILFFFIFSFY